MVLRASDGSQAVGWKRDARTSLRLSCACVVFFSLAAVRILFPAGHYGRVTVGGVPSPGATIVATQNDRQLTTVTDADGIYRFADLPDGNWTLRIEMLGFSPKVEQITVDADTPPPTWELALQPLDDVL